MQASSEVLYQFLGVCLMKATTAILQCAKNVSFNFPKEPYVTKCCKVDLRLKNKVGITEQNVHFVKLSPHLNGFCSTTRILCFLA